MTHHTHTIISLNAFFGVVLGFFYLLNMKINIEYLNPLLVGTVFGSLLPDIDEPKSWIGKRTVWISNLLTTFLRHRGATHYFIVPIMCFLFAFFIETQMISLFIFGLSFGILFHIFGDMLTIGGVYNVYFPFSRKTKRYNLLPKTFCFRTNSKNEHILSLILGVLMFFQYFLIYKNWRIV